MYCMYAHDTDLFVLAVHTGCPGLMRQPATCVHCTEQVFLAEEATLLHKAVVFSCTSAGVETQHTKFCAALTFIHRTW